MKKETQPGLVRAIGRWSLAALMLNSIIGGGIFGLPSIVAGLVGGGAPYAYLLAAAGMGVIVACFAEVASQFQGAGGPYLYARAAFGRLVGVEIAWLTWLARLAASAGVANLFVIYGAEFWPNIRDFLPRLLTLTLLLGFLATVNYRGVRGGAHLSDFFAVAKLLPLSVFIGVGIFSVYPAHFRANFSAGGGAWLQAVLLLVFAFGGFEGALIPMSEAREPRRDAPFVLFATLAATTLVYTLAQVVVTGVLSAPQQTDRPLADAARQFLGPLGAALIATGALISMYGNLSATMLYGPRLTFALAEQGDFPRVFEAVHPRFCTPYVSIVAFTLLAWVLAVAGSFRWNVTISAVARLFTYATTCGALPVLRKRQPGADALRLPAGSVWAFLGVAFCAVLIGRTGSGELLVLGATTVVALANWLWASRREKVGSP